MKLRLATTLAGALLAMGTAGCNDFLSSVEKDPNNVALENQAPGPLYVGVQTAQAVQFEGNLARLAAMYTQQIAGVSRQYLGYDIYLSTPADLDPYWQGVYSGGGLQDLRRIQRLTTAAGDSTWLGIAMVWEAFVIGNAASWWGDIPYREAGQPGVKPTFDSQLQVYGDVQTLLDRAIVLLSRGVGAGPRGSELIYGGRGASGLRAVYTRVAHTLKARFYMHLAEVDPTNYARAAAEARLGISTPDDDFNFFHDVAAASNNIHFQFYGTRGDVLAGAALVNVMKSRITAGKDVDNGRLGFYFTTRDENFDPVSASRTCGYRPAADPNLPGGAPPDTTCDFSFIAELPNFRQPMITFAENQLILAEACLQPSAGCAPTEAVDAYNAVRASEVYGATGDSPVTFGPQPAAVATVSLQDVMEEKYIDLFLNPEVWNDYKRTCLPRLAPAPRTVSSPETDLYNEIAGRFPYGLSEINTNQANIPTGATSTSRNRNDPVACPKLTYSTAY